MNTCALAKKAIQFLLLLSITTLLLFCKSSTQISKTQNNTVPNNTTTKNTTNSTSKKTSKQEKVNAILKEAYTYMGVPYKAGACSKKGIDCSGLVFNSFKVVNVDLPRTSNEQGNFAQTISVSDLAKGDLVFFCTKSANCKSINHVGIVSKLENGTAYFIHATVQKGVMVNHLNEDYYKKSFIKAGRVIN